MSITHWSSLTGLSALSLLSSAAQAQQAEPEGSVRFQVDDADPEAHLPSLSEANAHPLDFGYFLMDLEEGAREAAARGDWTASSKYHRAMTKLVPDNAAGFSSLCADYETLGKREEALDACRTTIGLEGAKVDDYGRLVRLVGNRPGGPDLREVEEAKAAIAHVQSKPGLEASALNMQCDLNLATHDNAAFKQCSERMLQLAPKDPRSIVFAWTQALREHDVERARSLLEQGKQNGLAPAALATMESKTQQVASTAGAQDGSQAGELVRGVHPMLRWLLGLLAAVLVGVLVSRKLARTNST